MYQEDLRDAMSQIIDMFLDTKVDISELQKTGSNPFVKMFANLRGRFRFQYVWVVCLDELYRSPFYC